MADDQYMGLLRKIQQGVDALPIAGPFGFLGNPDTMRKRMLDSLHGAARFAGADLPGGMVDTAAMLMSAPHMLGAPTPDFRKSPIGGSEWIGRQLEGVGLLRKQTGTTEELAGRMLLGPMLASPGVVGAVGDTAESISRRVAQNAAAPNRMSPQSGAVVWHGSPHKFDRFDSSKIGTGEGAQAYGHGLYLADSPDVAKHYKNALGAGRGISDNDTIARAIQMAGGDTKAAADDLAMRAQYANIPGGKEKLLALAEKVRAGYDPRGAVYKVDLPDDQISMMLDWDRPLSQQPPNVMAALKGVENNDVIRNAISQDWTGRKLLKELEVGLAKTVAVPNMPEGVTRSVGGPDAAARMLRQIGIPGTRYLDGNSRAAGDGARNYVVFPGGEDMLKILERQ